MESFKKIIIEGGIGLAILTVTLYLAAIGDASGYYGYYGLSSVVTYQINFFSMANAAKNLILIILLLGISAVTHFEALKDDKGKAYVIGSIIVSILFFSALVLLAFFQTNIKELIFICALGGLVFSKLFKNVSDKEDNFNHFVGNLQNFALLAIAGYLLFWGIYNANANLGEFRAIRKTEYMQLREDGNSFVLLYQDNEKYVFAPLVKEGKFLEEYRIFGIDDLQGRVLVPYRGELEIYHGDEFSKTTKEIEKG